MLGLVRENNATSWRKNSQRGRGAPAEISSPAMQTIEDSPIISLIAEGVRTSVRQKGREKLLEIS